MILSILKFVVAIIVAIISITLHVAKVLWNIISDGAAQAKEATPDVVDALKVHANETAAKAAPIAAKVNDDLRKTLKIPFRVKQEEPAQQQLQFN